MSDDNLNPFQSPEHAAVEIVAVIPAGCVVRPFATAWPRARWSIALVILCTLWSPVQQYANYRLETMTARRPPLHVESRSRYGPRRVPNRAALEAWQAKMAPLLQTALLTLVVSAAAGIPSAVLFLMWFHRVYRNLPALRNAVLTTTPGWAVGWWFIPVANLWMPYRIASEIWCGSVPTRDAERLHNPRRGRRSSLVLAWWLLILAPFVIGLAFTIIRANLTFHGNDGELLSHTSNLMVGVISALSGIVTVALIAAITKNQAARARMLTDARAA